MQADLENISFPALIGDIGGTNARFALIADSEAAVEQLPTVHTADHATIDDAIRSAVLERTTLRPRTAILALAGPIAGDRVPLTNCDWVVEPRRLIDGLGLSEVILLNDFEALSLSLPGLGPDDVAPIGDGGHAPHRARVVVGPGTGLGAGALVHARGAWIPVPGEGGHIDLAPMTAHDMALWPHLEHQDGRISGETLLSGGGMVRLYQGICRRDGVAARFATPADITTAGVAGAAPGAAAPIARVGPDVGRLARHLARVLAPRWGGGRGRRGRRGARPAPPPPRRPPPAPDPVAAETIALFATYLGRLAGNLALVFAAYGGVYLAGGISARIAPALKTGAFREAFVDKYPHRRMLERMATAIITKPYAALAGITDFARSPRRFGVELGGRWWRE